MVSRIFLIGFMGSGKSTFGSKLAGALGYRFVDMDRLIEETAGMTIPGIFSEHGEHIFRKWEHDILLEICRKEKIVISTGGGAPCHGEMMHIMNRHGATVYIKLPPIVLRDRLLKSKTDRPLIRGKSSIELKRFIEELLEEREKYYNQATLIIDGIEPDISELARKLKIFPGTG
jgi:shikimate kinase